MSQNNSKVVLLYLSLSHWYLQLEVTGKRMNCGGVYGLKSSSKISFLWAWKDHAVVGNETNKN